MTTNLSKAMKNNEIVKQEASIINLKGSELWYHSTIIPVERKKGQIETVLVISIESTERKKADLELSKLRILQKKIGVQFLTEHSHEKTNVNFMAKVTKIVADNIHDNNFDVNILAKHLFMSRSTLQRKLTKESGKSAALFIRHARLAKANELIKNNSHQTLAETAHAVGFKHPGYFAKLYKSIY
jgi:AraC-like DNA-binding protein